MVLNRMVYFREESWSGLEGLGQAAGSPKCTVACEEMLKLDLFENKTNCITTSQGE